MASKNTWQIDRYQQMKPGSKSLSVALTLRGDMPFGGAERRLLRIFNEIGITHRVSVLVRACLKTELQNRLDQAACCTDNFSEIRFSAPKDKIIGTLDSLRQLMAINPDVIISFDAGPFNRVMVRWMHFLGKHVVLTIANDLYYDEAMKGTENQALRRLLQKADHIDLLYPRQERYYRKLLQGKTVLTVTPGTFTDLRLFQPGKKERLFVFIAARLEDYKNPRMVLEAAIKCAPMLRKRGYKVLICGKGWEEDALRQMIRERGVSDVVEMPGYVKPHEILPRANVLCATNLINNYPSQTIAEAAACGCFLIATEVGETYRILDDSYSVGIPPPQPFRLWLKKWVGTWN